MVFYDIITLIASGIVIIGGIIALYVYWSWTKFARGKWTIRDISFYSPQAVQDIFIVEIKQRLEAPPGKLLPPGTITVSPSKDGLFVPVGGLRSIEFKGTISLPAVLVHFVIVNPSIIPVAINEVTLTIKHLTEGRTYRFAPQHFGKKEGVDKPGAPARVQFDDYWGSILIKPASCSAHRLVFAPALLKPSIAGVADDKIFTDLVAGEYECSVELKFERLFRLMRNKAKSRCITRKVDISELLVDEWKHNKPVVV